MSFTDTMDEKELELSKEYRCRVCKERCKTLTQLRDHLQTRHKTARFACRKCNYSSERKSNLIRHTETSHQTTKRPVQDQAQIPTTSGTSGEDRHVPKYRKRDDVKTTPRVQREVLPSYAPTLADLLARSPEGHTFKTINVTSPTSPEKKVTPGLSPREIQCDPVDETGMPDPRLFQGETETLEDQMTETGSVMEKARKEAQKMPAAKTSCEWKLVEMTERKTYVVTTETAVKDGFYYRRVREEHLE